MKINLLDFKKNIFSQNGEDGIIEKIFELIGTRNKICCEFGAWDGLHYCNTRNLIINKSWRGILIEDKKKRFLKIKKNYQGFEIFPINSHVDSVNNKLSNLFDKNTNITDKDIDLLSIDIDGLDYEILETMIIRPNVICIEVNAGHSPFEGTRIDRKIAKRNIGQPLKVFTDIARKMGYSLVCYSGNAFYVKNQLLVNSGLEPVSEEEAYLNFLSRLTAREKAWLYLVNEGKVPPFYKYGNPLLEKKKLGLKNAEINRLTRRVRNIWWVLKGEMINIKRRLFVRFII